ncbi:MAG: hypothetical protein QNJ97_02830 [Myxococcota bacterium]|nr:hypothetical protein [Myxococcota bacterium]
MNKRNLLLLLLLLLVGSCESGLTSCNIKYDGSDEESLDNGLFKYVCVDEIADPTCDNVLPPIPFPSTIAVGALFTMAYERSDNLPSSLNQIHFVPAFESQVDLVSYDVLRIKTPEVVTVFAVDYIDVVVDLIYLQGGPVQSLMIAKKKPNPEWGSWEKKWEETLSASLYVGQPLEFRAFPKGGDGEILSGVLEYQWSVGDDTILSAVPVTGTTVIQAIGLAAGPTTLTVMSEHVTHRIDITVEAQETDTDTDSAIDLDASVDAG